MYKFNYIFKLIFNWYIANILKVVKLPPFDSWRRGEQLGGGGVWVYLVEKINLNILLPYLCINLIISLN